MNLISKIFSYQRSPVGVEITYFQCWHKLGAGDNQKIEIQEELELFI